MRILSIPEHVDLVAYLTLGYVERFPERPELEEKGWLSRLPLEELVYIDTLGKKLDESFINVLRNSKF